MPRLLMSALLVFVFVTTTRSQQIAVPSGTKLQSILVTTMDMDMDVNGNPMANKFETTNISDIEVMSGEADGFIFLNTLRKIMLNALAHGKEIKFDSDKPEDLNGEMGAAFKDKLNKTDTFLVSKSGRIEKAPRVFDHSGMEMTNVSDMVNQYAVGHSYPMLMPLPEGKLPAVGESWTDSSGTPETMKVVSTHKLESIEGNDILVSSSSIISNNIRMEQEGNEMTVQIGGPMTARSTYDRETGLLKNSVTNMQITGKMLVSGQNINFTLKGDLKTDVTKK